MAKRGQNEGSIVKLDSGRWRGLVSVNGKRLSRNADTRKEIQEWIIQITGQVEQGLTYAGAKTTIGDYLTNWLASKSDLRPRTYNHYKSLCNIYLIKDLGKIPIKDLSAGELQDYYGKWAKNGTRVNTVAKLHKILHQVLMQAEKTGLVHRNITEFVTPPRIPRKEMHYWSETEANHFLAAAQTDRYYALFQLALSTGMRQMELLGLKWQDLDLVRGTLHVSRQLSRSGGLLNEPKTNLGYRSLYLGAETLQALKEHSKKQLFERHFFGDDWKDQSLIFTNKKGGPVDYKTLVIHHFKVLVKRAGIPMIRFHDMRHTNATILLSHGIPPVIVAGRLGHSMNVLMATYAHFIPSTQDEAAQLIDELITPIPISIKDPA